VIELLGERVLLRGYRPEEIDAALVRMDDSMRQLGLDARAEARASRRARLERSGTRTEWEVMFAIVVDSDVVGDVQARCSDQAMPQGVWEIGIEIHDERDRGRGIGREAVALLTAHLFSEQGAHRVQASTDVGNTAMRRVLEALGFTDEGTLRGFMPMRDGPPRDYEMYAITSDDWTGNG
jgi:RimJ/RimL family protein N-acetyltransferase